MNSTTKREEYLARLERISSGLEAAAESLPARGEHICREDIITLTSALTQLVGKLRIVADETWAWAQTSGHGTQMQRADKAVLVDLKWADRGLMNLEYAMRTTDGEAAFWRALSVIDHARECVGYVESLLGVAVEAAA